MTSSCRPECACVAGARHSSADAFTVQAVIDDGGKDVLQKMYANWPFFSVTLDMMEMVFAKADPRVAEFYEKSLVAEELWGFGTDMRQ